MSEEVKKSRPTRKVQAGPYKISRPVHLRSDTSRDALVGRAKRHVRGVEMGSRKVTDPDEEVRILKGATTPRHFLPPRSDISLDDDE